MIWRDTSFYPDLVNPSKFVFLDRRDFLYAGQPALCCRFEAAVTYIALYEHGHHLLKNSELAWQIYTLNGEAKSLYHRSCFSEIRNGLTAFADFFASFFCQNAGQACFWQRLP